MACKVLAVAQTKSEKVKLQGLDTNKQYRNTFTGKVYSGDFLMYHGIRANYEMKDFSTVVFEFAEIKADDKNHQPFTIQLFFR